MSDTATKKESLNKGIKKEGKDNIMGTPITSGGEDTASAGEPEVTAHSEETPIEGATGTPITTGGDGNPEGGEN